MFKKPCTLSRNKVYKKKGRFLSHKKNDKHTAKQDRQVKQEKLGVRNG